MTFQKRLHNVLQRGNLRTADLARWFDRPHATVSEWIKNGREPTGGPKDVEQIFDRLERLEHLIEHTQKFPLPRLSPSQRIQYLGKLL